MPDHPTPNWQPIGLLTFIAALSDEQLAHARDQHAVLSNVRDGPPVLDDATVARVIALYQSERELLPVQKEQLARWRRLSLTAAQAKELDRLERQTQAIETLIGDILALAEELKRGTVETVLAKSDAELGREALRRPIRESDMKAARELLSPDQLDAAIRIDAKMKILLAQGGDEIAILARMTEHMDDFKRLIDAAPRDGLDLLLTRFPGFFNVRQAA